MSLARGWKRKLEAMQRKAPLLPLATKFWRSTFEEIGYVHRLAAREPDWTATLAAYARLSSPDNSAVASLHRHLAELTRRAVHGVPPYGIAEFPIHRLPGGCSTRVRLAGRRLFAGAVLVPVQAVDADGVEAGQEAFPHQGKGKPVQPRVVGDEADDALGGFLAKNAGTRHAEEAGVKVVQPLPLRLKFGCGMFAGAIAVGERFFLVRGDAGVTA